ncbi:MAG: hypothetical protein AB1714_30295 [Acidobacteriota bacterium]
MTRRVLLVFLSLIVVGRFALAQQAAGGVQVSIAGVRITGPGFGEDGTELRPFDVQAGTTLVLVFKVPPKAGIVEIDDDACSLTSVTDDKGTNLMEEVDFGPFPKIAKDGTVGMLEVTTRGRPAAGATSVSAQGVLVFTSATGSKPQKVTNVKLENGATFKLGKTTISVSEVTAEAESMSLTLTLPSSILATIKGMRFLDAKGVDLEAHRSMTFQSGGEAQVSYDVPAVLKTAAIEFDIWQGLKSQQVPFSLRAAMDLGR